MVNMGVARAIAYRYHRRGMNLDDLIQVAFLGLMKAVNGFDPARERDFLSYAVPTISGEVKRYFRDFGWTVRPPRRLQELQVQILTASSALAQRWGRLPSPLEVAEELGVDVDPVIEALAADGCFTPTSLDLSVGRDGSVSLGSLLSDPRDDFACAEARVMLAPVLPRLSPRDQRLVELRFFRG
ncbi:MAG: sigma-70 family RNA polymerase sigma factor [Nocardioidaceae bacterium]